MANKTVAGPKAAGQYTFLWMLLALVLIAGFMVWLAISSEPTTVAVVEEEGAEAGEDGAVRVSLAELSANPLAYAGEDVHVANVQVVSRLGEQAFWTQFPDDRPFLIKLGATLVEQGVSVGSGEVVGVTGSIQLMNDSVLAAWKEAGAITDDGQEAEASFATSFLEARSVQAVGTTDRDDAD